MMTNTHNIKKNRSLRKTVRTAIERMITWSAVWCQF